MNLRLIFPPYSGIHYDENTNAENPMKKMELDKALDIKLTSIDPSDMSFVADNMQAFFKPFSLDKEILSRLRTLPLASIYGVKGKPYLCPTLKDMYNQFIDEIDYLPTSRKFTSTKLRIEENELSRLEANAYLNLVKGVNKNLPTPIVVFDAFSPENIKSIRENQGTPTTAHPCLYVEDEDLVPFNPKNIAKHYGFPMLDAKTFFKNFMSYHPQKVKLLAKGALSKPKTYTRNVFILNFGEKPLAIWSYNQDFRLREKLEGKHITDIEQALDLAHHDLPIPDLQVWKSVAQSWYERNTHIGAWDEISIRSQQKHIVNTIRHNSVGYDQIWRCAKPEFVAMFHDKVFELTLKKIISTFPYLAEECKRQLEFRNI